MNAPLFHRVLVPLDGSSTAEAILPQLRPFLTRHQSSLTVLQSLPLRHEKTKEEAEHYLRRMAFQLTNDGFPSKYSLRQGSAVEAILGAAADEQATLIALSTHGRSGIDRWVLGSVAEAVLHSSPVPVLLVRSVPSSGPQGIRPALPLRSILLPLDGSVQALAALDPVLALARGMDARVRLLHVDEPCPAPGQWESPDEFSKKADRILREACIPASFELRRGHPAQEILKAVVEHHIGLIAMTTHGRSGPPRWLMGSVTEEVLRHSTVPLLVVRRPRNDKDSAAATKKASLPVDILASADGMT